MTDTHDQQAVLALGAKILRFLAENHALNDEISTRQARVAANQSAISDCVSGLRPFGIDLNAEGVWDQFIVDYGERITFLTKGPAHSPATQTLEPMTPQTFIVAQQPISLLLLDRLRDVGFHGSKALPLRNFLKQQYNIDTHYKTVGMTLYRLSQESPPKVHRKGHTWFFGPPLGGDQKNPGAGTPGQTSLLDEEGGTDA